MEQIKNVDIRFAETVRQAAEKKILPHGVIISGEGDALSAGRFLAAAYLCEEPGAPCLRCAVCRKVMENIHPDLITVEETQKKELAVEDVRRIRASVYIRPNEGARKVYLFPRCAQLSEKDQNVLLKIVEEGPAYGAFIFCTESAGSLLPTVRSRCTELKLHQEEEAPDVSRVLPLLRCADKPGAALQYFADLESKKLKREELQELLEAAWECAAQELLRRRGKPPAKAGGEAAQALQDVPDKKLAHLVGRLRHYAAQCQYNVGPAHILGALMVELTEQEETP